MLLDQSYTPCERHFAGVSGLWWLISVMEWLKGGNTRWNDSHKVYTTESAAIVAAGPSPDHDRQGLSNSLGSLRGFFWHKCIIIVVFVNTRNFLPKTEKIGVRAFHRGKRWANNSCGADCFLYHYYLSKEFTLIFKIWFNAYINLYFTNIFSLRYYNL